VRLPANHNSEIRHDQKMAHLLDRHIDNCLAPSFERFALSLAHARLPGALEAERGVKVAAHERVLDLRGLRKQVE
jgi:hypothetical protein